MAKKVKLFPDEHKKGGRDMNSRILRRVMLSLALVVACTFAFSFGASAAPAADTKKFEEYRAAIKKAHGIDIKNYKQKLKGGRADGKQVTDFDLDQLIMGIKVEQEHTTDKYTALEISMDHLEEIPDYYTRLEEMEEKAEAEWKVKKEAAKKK
jgi:predicted 3-demethylubiquinone-9 3-methyltransferase (glyoxalase superfamily)